MKSFKKEIQELFKKYDNLYKVGLTESTDIEMYGINEFLGGKREAFQEVLEIIEK